MPFLTPRRKERLEKASIAFAICHDLPPKLVFSYAAGLLNSSIAERLFKERSAFADAVRASSLGEDGQKVHGELIRLLRKKLLII
jgi:hypothetical protein